MVRRGTSVLVGLLGLAVAAALSGCSEKSCSAVGAENGVSVAIDQRWLSAGADEVEVCSVPRCASTTFPGDATGPVFVAYPLGPSEQDVTVRVLRGGRLLVERAVRVTPTTVQPNGPDCEPTAYQAGASI